MSKPRTPNRPVVTSDAEDRRQRLATALRANLKRRREQKRTRAGDSAPDKPIPGTDTRKP